MWASVAFDKKNGDGAHIEIDAAARAEGAEVERLDALHRTVDPSQVHGHGALRASASCGGLDFRARGLNLHLEMRGIRYV